MQNLKRALPLNLAIYGLYVLVALVITWPLVTVLSTHFAGYPFGDAHEMTRHIWWIKTALQTGQPVTLVGRGDQRHAFVSMADVVAFALAAVDNPAAFNQRIAIGGAEAVTWTEVVRRVSNSIGQELTITYVPVGSPLPIPPATWGLMYSMEMYEAVIPMDDVITRFGVSLTPLDVIAKRLFSPDHK